MSACSMSATTHAAPSPAPCREDLHRSPQAATESSQNGYAMACFFCTQNDRAIPRHFDYARRTVSLVMKVFLRSSDGRSTPPSGTSRLNARYADQTLHTTNIFGVNKRTCARLRQPRVPIPRISRISAEDGIRYEGNLICVLLAHPRPCVFTSFLTRFRLRCTVVYDSHRTMHLFPC